MIAIDFMWEENLFLFSHFVYNGVSRILLSLSGLQNVDRLSHEIDQRVRNLASGFKHRADQDQEFIRTGVQVRIQAAPNYVLSDSIPSSDEVHLYPRLASWKIKSRPTLSFLRKVDRSTSQWSAVENIASLTTEIA